MIERCLKVNVIDDDKTYLELFRVFFDDRKKNDAFPFPIYLQTFLATNTNDSVQEMLETDADMYFIDQRLPGMTGIEIAKNLLTKRPHLPVAVFSADTKAALFDLSQSAELSEKIRAKIDFQLKPATLEEFVSRSEQFIKQRALKAVTVGIVGFGEFGQHFYRACLDAPGTVKNIYLLSQNLFFGDEGRIDLETYIHTVADLSPARTTIIANLQELIKQMPDIILYAKGPAKKRKAERPDRADLMPDVIEDVFAAGKILKRDISGIAKQKILKIVASNPIGGVMELWRRIGIPVNQMTFPFMIDVDRATTYLQRYLNTEEYAIIEPYCRSIMGLHGRPEIPIQQHFKKLGDRISKCLRTSWEAGNFEIKMRIERNIASVDPPKKNV